MRTFLDTFLESSVLSRRALAAVWTAAAAHSALPSRAAAAGGPSSLSGKPRPETGVVLLEPVDQSGRTISAELLLAASNKATGISAVAVFESAFPLARGNYYDVESRNKEGDAAFIHVASLPMNQNKVTERHRLLCPSLPIVLLSQDI